MSTIVEHSISGTTPHLPKNIIVVQADKNIVQIESPQSDENIVENSMVAQPENNIVKQKSPQSAENIVENSIVAQLEKNTVKQKSAQSDKNIVPLEPPDGGWGWVVVAGGNLSLCFAAMTGPCFGVLFSRPLLDMGASSTTVAWIFNVCQLISQFSGIFVGPLVKVFGFRKTGMVFGFITALSLLLSSFAKSPEFLYFSFSILGGIGAGMTMTIPFLIVPLYFKRLLGRATTFMIMGVNVGQIIGPGLVSYLQDQFGFKGATLIMSAMFLHCVVGATFFHPVEWHMKRVTQVHHPLLSTSDKDHSENNSFIHNTDRKINSNNDCSLKSNEESSMYTTSLCNLKNGRTTSGIRSSEANTKDPESEKNTFLSVIKKSFNGLKILKSPCASIICFGGAFVFNGFFNLYVFLPFAIQSRGLPLQVAALCISASAVCNLSTRLVLSVIVDKPWFNKTFSYMFGNCVLVVTAIVFPWMTTQVGMTVVMMFWGTGLSLNVSLHNLLMIQYMGLENLPDVLGASRFINGLVFITVGPIIGVIRDVTNNYTVAINVLGGTISICFVLWLFMPMAVAYEKRKRKLLSEKQ